MVEHIVQQIIRDHKRTMNAKVKNMNELYNNTDTCRVVKTGIWKNVRYWISTIGIHPCAYVECSEQFLEEHKDEYGNIEGIYVHGGVTFGGRLGQLRAFQSENVEGVIAFGWDYGHCNDWAGYHSDEDNIKFGNKKWEIDEIELECKEAINQYLMLVAVEKNKVDETRLLILKNRDLQGMVDDDEIDLSWYEEVKDYVVKIFESKEKRDGYIEAMIDLHRNVELVYGNELKKVKYD